MGKQISVTKFRGLVTNPNALTTADGAMEQANNVTISQPDLITKRRGFRTVCRSDLNYISFGLYSFLGTVFEGHATLSLNATDVDVSVVSPVSRASTALDAFRFSLTLSATNYVWRPLVSVDSYAANTSWECSTKYEIRKLSGAGEINWTTFRAVPVVMGDTITGNFMWAYDHDALGRFNTTVGGAFGMIPFGARAHVLFHTTSPYKSYIIAHEAFTSISSKVSSRSGVPEALDCDAIPGPDALTDRYAGPINPNCQVSYRVVFVKRYSDGTEVFGAPSPICTVVNSKRPCTSVTDQTTEWRFNAPVNDIEGNSYGGNESVYLYSVTGTGATPPSDGTSYLITTNTTTSYFQVLKTAFPAGFTPTGCSWSTAATGYINATIPSNLASTDNMFARLYRTTCSIDETASPTPRFFLVEEKSLASVSNFISFVDSMTDDVLQFQEELYTNEDTQDGEAQAAYKYPEAVDSIASYKNCVFLANPKAKDYYDVTIIKDPTYATPLDFKITFGVAVNYTGQIEGNGSVGNSQHIWYVSAFAAPNVTLTVTGQPYPLVAAANSTLVNGSVIEVYENNAGITAGRYTVTGSTGTTITFAMSGSATVGKRLSLARYAEGSFTQFSADTSAAAGDYWRYGISFALQKTAEMIAKCVNRKAYTNTTVKANGNLASTVGLMTFATRDYLEVGETETLGLFSDSVGTVSFYPALPSIVTPQRNAVLAVSRLGEPESFPLLNRINVGSQSETILGMSTTRDSLIVIKSDGVFRVNGDSPQNFVSAAIDTTVICMAPGSIFPLNNTVYFLSNQGVVQVSDTGVRIISMAIENLLLPVIGNATAMSQTHAYASEADRTYFLSTFDPDGNRVTYAYNYMTETWTTSDEHAFSGVSLPNGDTYILSTDQVTIKKQNRGFLPSDYSQNPDSCIIWTGVRATGSNLPGEKKASVTFLQAHGLTAGNTVTCSAYLSSCTNRIAAASIAVTVVLTVDSVTSPTVAVFDITNLQAAAPVGADSVNLVLRDADLSKAVVAVNSAGDAPVVLDALSDNLLVFIPFIPVIERSSVVAATYTPDSATWFLQQVTLRDAIPVVGGQGAIWKRIVSDVVMSPLDQSSEDTLKQYSTSQVHFRNDKSCSRMKIGFSNDFTNATSQTSWVAPGFTGPTSTRKYISGRQNVLRTYVPLDCSVGTWIQPRMNHEVACEPWEVQIVSVQVESETDVTTRGEA
jgi:hypothetical protein